MMYQLGELMIISDTKPLTIYKSTFEFKNNILLNKLLQPEKG